MRRRGHGNSGLGINAGAVREGGGGGVRELAIGEKCWVVKKAGA